MGKDTPQCKGLKEAYKTVNQINLEPLYAKTNVIASITKGWDTLGCSAIPKQ